jgi:hypothetical protein
MRNVSRSADSAYPIGPSYAPDPPPRSSKVLEIEDETRARSLQFLPRACPAVEVVDRMHRSKLLSSGPAQREFRQRKDDSPRGGTRPMRK